MSAKRVMLINMPFTTRWGPAIGLSLLKAALLRDGVACDLKYFNLKFAASIGGEFDDQIVFFIFDPLLGEWLFAEDLFGDRIPLDQRRMGIGGIVLHDFPGRPEILALTIRPNALVALVAVFFA